MKRILHAFSALVFTTLFGTLSAQTSFNGAVDSDWSNASNWTNGLPAMGNDATIERDVYCYMPESEITVDYDITVYGGLVTSVTDTLEVATDGSISVMEDGVLSVQYVLVVEGYLSNDGHLIMEGNTFIEEDGELVNHGEIQMLENWLGMDGTVSNWGYVFSCGSYGSSATADISGDEFIANLCDGFEICDGIDNDLDGWVDDNTCGTTFTAAVSNDFSDPDNWSNLFPDVRNPGTIPAGLTATVPTDENWSTYFDLYVEGTLEVGSWTYFFGSLYNTGTVSAVAYTDFNLANGEIINHGTFTGDMDLDLGVLNNFENHSVMDISELTNMGNVDTHNTGTITLSGNLSNNLFCNFYNDGTLNVGGTATNYGNIYNCSGTYNGPEVSGNAFITTDCPGYEICDDGIDNDQDGFIDEDCGCTNPLACNYDADATRESECQLPGCTIESACNYDPSAVCGETSDCDFEDCKGCTYASADNYDPAATIDDGSCTGPTDNPCLTDLDGDYETGTADILLLLGAFGSSCE